MNALVVGANGQLGAACCRALAAEGHVVRGSVRDLSRADGLDLAGAELVVADLARDPDLDALLDGVDAVVLTANSAAPRAGDDLHRFAEGEEHLVEAAGRLGVQRVVLPSVPVTDVDDRVPLVTERRRLERLVRSAVPGSVVLRFPPFMEVWLALAGSSLPLRGEPNATAGRASPSLLRYRRLTGSLVERRGLLLVPGPTSYRQAFIAIADVAAACAAAVGRPEVGGETIEVPGPEVLSWAQVADLYSSVLGRRVRAISTPTAVFGVLSTVLGRVDPVTARTMALNRLAGAAETVWQPGGGGLVDPAGMTTVEQFLNSKAALPAVP